VRDREFFTSAGEMAVYRRISHHLSAAFRCRRRLGATQPPPAPVAEPAPIHVGAEAILDSEGRFAHAEGEAAGRSARERIRAAATSIDRLRSRRHSPGRGAIDTWHPLVSARWTLVDSFEENGRRYVVAQENQAMAPGFDILTDRERQVVLQAALGSTTKEIAYALGISDSTVRVLMARAVNRVGVRSRAELLSHPSLQGLRPSNAHADDAAPLSSGPPSSTHASTEVPSTRSPS
jgi:DNA-binding CsgD family transcriptional regulator